MLSRLWTRPPDPVRAWIRVARQAMACRFEVILPDRAAPVLDDARAALDTVEAVEAQLSVFRESSDISRVNRAAAERPVAVDAALFGFLRMCEELHVETEGAFDVTSTPLSRCWGFMQRQGRVPTTAERETALFAVGMSKVRLDPVARTVYFKTPGLELNFGAIGKGYALDVMAETLRRVGLREALLSAGSSSVLAVGGEWPVDLRSPQVTDRPLARLTLRRGALGTSGAGEQFAVIDGRRYGHIIDPRTGWPSVGVLSASVVAEDGACADALATAFFVGGTELARRYCERHPNVLAIITPDDAQRRPQVFGRYDGVRVDQV